MADDLLPLDKRRTPDLPAPGKRKPLSRFDYATLFLAQLGRCYLCGEKLKAGQVIDEHVVPRENLSAEKCDLLENRKLACRPCAKAKTVTDQAAIASSRHQRGGKGSQRAKQIARGKGSILGRSSFGVGQKLKSGPTKWPSRSFGRRG